MEAAVLQGGDYMALSDQALALGAIYGVVTEFDRQSRWIKGEGAKPQYYDSNGMRFTLLAVVAVEAYFVANSVRGFAYMLFMPIGVYKVAQLLVRGICLTWFYLCWDWWKARSDGVRTWMRRGGIVLLIVVVLAAYTWGRRDCTDETCPQIEGDWV